MKKYLMLAFLSLGIIACSSMSKNFTQRGELIFDGGVYQGKTWSQNLVFKRMTWYNEFTTAFDVAFYRIDSTSPYFDWFSAEEKATVRTSSGPCFIAFYYSLDSKRLPPSIFKEQIKEMGGDFKLFRNFYENLLNHPQAPYYSLSMYTREGICFAHPVEKIMLDVPGFNTVEIK